MGRGWLGILGKAESKVLGAAQALRQKELLFIPASALPHAACIPAKMQLRCVWWECLKSQTKLCNFFCYKHEAPKQP